MKKPGTATRRTGTVRCAIYTRKSSEEGLEQEFNSLQAQREACEAFIASQRHEGWMCLRASYDDGGFSGATMDRPALQQLLAPKGWGGFLIKTSGGQLREVEGPAIRKLFDWLIIGRTLSVNPAHAVRGPTHFVRHGNTPVLTEEQTFGVVQPPLAASLYSASLTRVPQAVP
jgi:hypothetical protein